MNTVSDLRHVLDEHADRISDREAAGRPAAIRRRVSVIRRRRQATGMGALALTLIVVGAAAAVHRATSDALPSAPTVLGVKAPTTIDSLGYTYRTDGSAQVIAGDGSIDIGASSQPRLVSWTTQQPTTVRLQLPGGGYWTSTQSAFHDFVVIPPGSGGALRVSTDSGRVGLATYDLTAARPAGLTRDGITFRSEVAGARLRTAVIGASGAVEAHTTYHGTRGETHVAVLCAGAPPDATIHVRFGRLKMSSSPCSGSTFDPGSDVIGSNHSRHVGQSIPLRVWMTAPASSTYSVSRLRLGVGLYSGGAEQQVAGSPVARRLEYGGHEWQLSRVRSSGGGSIRFTQGSQPSTAWLAVRPGAGQLDLTLSASGMPPQQGGLQGGGSLGSFWIPAASRVVVRASPAAPFGVATYRPLG